jgi:hypothetical protein
MDEASCHTIEFLEALQEGMCRLGDTWGYYVGRGARPARPFLVLSGRPFRVHEMGSSREFNGAISLGLEVKGADGKEYELSVGVLWSGERWTITTETAVVADAGGQSLLRELPERTAVDLSGCTEHLLSAIDDLVGFADLIPTK